MVLASGEVVATHGVMNPQIRFGDDLMSRVSYVMMNPGGEVELTRVVRQALDALIDYLKIITKASDQKAGACEAMSESSAASHCAVETVASFNDVAMIGAGSRPARSARSLDRRPHRKRPFP